MLDIADNSGPALRPASQVMRLARMGQGYPHRLSFSRLIIRRLLADNAQVSRPLWQMDANGYGQAVYTVNVGGYDYSLVAVSSALDDSQRSDRVIAEAWDACFTLFDGIPDQADLDRLSGCQIHQEASRYTVKELTLSRANKSMRLFAHVRDALAAGKQPDADQVNSIGYLMRTTAVYGNGKFGIADRHAYCQRPGMEAPFQAEMLTVWLIREFTHDLVEHCARAINPKAVSLDARLKLHLGVGNSTGLGMAPFLVHHPALLHQWVWTRETALQAALQQDDPVPEQLIQRVQRHLSQWDVDDQEAQADIETTRQECQDLAPAQATALMQWSTDKSLGTQELVVSLILESTSAEIDTLAQHLSTPAPSPVDWRTSVAALREICLRQAGWALENTGDDHWFWYVSANKAEPRIGDRHTQAGVELEKPLAIANKLSALMATIDSCLAHDPAASCLELAHQSPELTGTIARVLDTNRLLYAEIQENLIGKDLRPIDMLRFKLSFFGASKFDPKSVLWTRITLFQGAPCRESLNLPGDDWWLSAL